VRDPYSSFSPPFFSLYVNVKILLLRDVIVVRWCRRGIANANLGTDFLHRFSPTWAWPLNLTMWIIFVFVSLQSTTIFGSPSFSVINQGTKRTNLPAVLSFAISWISTRYAISISLLSFALYSWIILWILFVRPFLRIQIFHYSMTQMLRIVRQCCVHFYKSCIRNAQLLLLLSLSSSSSSSSSSSLMLSTSLFSFLILRLDCVSFLRLVSLSLFYNKGNTLR